MSRKLTTSDFIQRAQLVHKNRYLYNKVNYTNSNTKVVITCSTHGDFEQRAMDHLNGFRCNKCSRTVVAEKNRTTLEDFIKQSALIHNNKYDYSKVNYINNSTKVDIICPSHGVFQQAPAFHKIGNQCPECAYIQRASKNSLSYKEFLDNANRVHNNTYDYTNTVYTTSQDIIDISCKTHGSFKQIASNHLMGSGCPECFFDTLRISKEDYIKRAEAIHGNRFDYTKIELKTLQDYIEIICPVHGIFTQRAITHLSSVFGCKKCSRENSKYEELIEQYLVEHNIKFERNILLNSINKDITNKEELDFYIPDYNLAIEIDGIYWHSELNGRAKSYHLHKSEKCKEIGIHLIHIFTSDFLQKDIIYSRLNHLLHLNKDKKIFARKCVIRNVDCVEASIFLNNNHLRGADNASTRLGLYFNNELVSIMTFGAIRDIYGASNLGTIEMIRFCSKLNYNVIGAAGKLLKFYENNYKPVEIISYADKRWSDDSCFYSKLGFTLKHKSAPNYWYFNRNKDNTIYHRYMFAKHTLKNKLQNFNPELTEWENMKANGYDRIWDCGNYVFKKQYQ